MRTCNYDGCDRVLAKHNTHGYCTPHRRRNPEARIRRNAYLRARRKNDPEFKRRELAYHRHYYWLNNDYRNKARRKKREYWYLKWQFEHQRKQEPCEVCGEHVEEGDPQVCEVNGMPMRKPIHIWCLIPEFEECKLEALN